VNAVMNFRVPYNAGISWLVENRLASQEGLCCLEWVSIMSISLMHIRFVQLEALKPIAYSGILLWRQYLVMITIGRQYQCNRRSSSKRNPLT
jgi:hypothetical protein